MTLGRQIGAVIVGIVFSFLAAAASGYFLYRISDQWPHAGPILARYLLDPFIALLTGALVGAIAKYHPVLLSTLSLVPSESLPLLNRRLESAHLLFMVFLAVISLLLGAAAAKTTFRLRARRLESGLART